MTDKLNEQLFFQRIEELAKRSAERYNPEFTHFLDAASLRKACVYVNSCNHDVFAVVYGGFCDAERCVLGFFPKDVYCFDGFDINELYSMFEVSGIVIESSGFGTFSHRDVMGSVLGLGIKREAMGDIYVTEDGCKAYICLTNVAAQYVCDNLKFVSRDKVKCKVINPSDLPVPERKFAVISGTVASDRLDCLVSLATKVSREKAKQLITSGFVSLNHEEELRCDIKAEQGDVLSVRGFGRFKIAEYGDVTRKGRNRVVVHKMI